MLIPSNFLTRNAVSILAMCTVLSFSSAVMAMGSLVSSEYVCFSLRSAENLLRSESEPTEEILTLVKHVGFITDPVAIVIDSENLDCILVGRRDPSIPPIWLDDLVIALRRYAEEREPEEKPPGVSIEIIPGEGGTAALFAKYFGGIEDNHFGKTCYEADYLLKRISLGLQDPGSPKLPDPKVLRASQARESEDEPVQPRLQFFYPSVARVLVSDDAVVLDECLMAVETAVGDAEGRYAGEDEESPEQVFATELTKNYAEIANEYPVLAELRNLMILVGLARGLRDVDKSRQEIGLPGLKDGTLSFFLNEYPVSFVRTTDFDDIVEIADLGTVYSKLYLGEIRFYPVVVRNRSLERFESGDPYVFSYVVSKARPSNEALVWPVHIAKKSLQALNSEDEDLWTALGVGQYLLLQGRPGESIEWFERAASMDRESGEPFFWKAQAQMEMQDLNNAAATCETGLQLDPLNAMGLTTHGLINYERSHPDEAGRDIEAALVLNPGQIDALRLKAQLALDSRNFAEAEQIVEAILKSYKGSSVDLVLKGHAELELGAIEAARKSWREALDTAVGTTAYLETEDSIRRIGGEAKRFVKEQKRESVSTVMREQLKQHYIEATIGLQTGYDMRHTLTGVYSEDTYMYFIFPVTLSWAYRNRFRIDAGVPFELNIHTFDVFYFFEFKDIYGIIGGLGRPSVGLSLMAWGDETTSLNASAKTFAPKPEKLFEEWVTSLDVDLDDILPWEDPFWFQNLEMNINHRLYPQVSANAGVYTRLLFGIDPVEHQATGDLKWNDLPEKMNWGFNGALRFRIAGDDETNTGLLFMYMHDRTGTNYSPSMGLLHRHPSRVDDRIGFGFDIQGKNSLYSFFVGINLTSFDMQHSKDVSWFISAGNSGALKLFRKWF
jgi:tetratricopeptide (TPR) repeat protein